jgi:hypothetical protein
MPPVRVEQFIVHRFLARVDGVIGSGFARDVPLVIVDVHGNSASAEELRRHNRPQSHPSASNDGN